MGSDGAVATANGRSLGYRFTSGFAILGLTAGTFCSTVITNEAGGMRFGALVTAVWIVLLVAGRLLVAPYLPLVIKTFGPRRTFLFIKFASLVLWSLLGLFLVSGTVGAAALYATAPIFGAIAAFASTLTTLYTGAYVVGHEMSGALARMAVVRGGAVALGAVLAGLITVSVGPAWGIFARGAFEIPLIIFLLVYRPSREPQSPEASKQVWHGLVNDIRSNKALHLPILMGIGLTIFAMPFSELLVPISSQLRPESAISGAALLVASVAIGQSLSILPVNALHDRYPATVSAAFMGSTRGLALILFALVGLVLTGGFELLVWALIGLAFGMTRAASGALMVGSATSSVTEENRSRALIAFSFSCTLASPIGVLLWGALMSVTSVETTLLVAGLGAFLVSAFAFQRARTTTQQEPGQP